MTLDAAIPRSNLPAPVSSFIGRERELGEVARLLRQRRLVTLTGVGGTGKTRLALRAAAAELDHFPDGVWLVGLAPLTGPELVAETIAKVVEAPATGGQSPLEVLGATLGLKRVLLLLDNCEHVVVECARVVAHLLAHCPSLVVLATSREPLAVGGEWILRVPPLSVPGAAEALDEDRLLAYDGIRLFIERAQAAESSFSFSHVTAPSVVEICRQLDGIPLALELAAMRVRGMGVANLSARLHDRFRLLTVGDRVAESRQQTLHALVDWSYGLLSERERVVMRRLGVFAGDFSPEAAEAVCAVAGGKQQAATESVLDDLTRLVDKSLVQFDQDSGLYRLLETIRLYCVEQLAAAGETNHLHRQHFVYYLQLAEDGAPLIGGAGEMAWFARLEQEHDNFRAALGWAIRAGRGDEAARLALALWRFWRARTYQKEGLRWLEQIHALDAANPLPADLRPRMLNALGVLAQVARQFDRARAYQDEALHLWTVAGDQAGMAQALIDMGWQLFEEVDLARTKQRAVESLPLAESSGDKRLLASALLLDGLADLHADMDLLFGFGTGAEGDASALLSVVPTLERSLALWRELGDSGSEASALALLGFVYQGVGDYARAKALLGESARRHIRLGDAGNLNGTLVGLMNMAAKTADGPEKAGDAARMFGALISLGDTVAGEPSPWDTAEPARKLTERLTSLLGREGYERAVAEGRGLTTAGLLALVDRITAPDLACVAPPPAPRGAPHDDLTPREREVLRFVAKGMTNAQVARELVVTPRTVNAHLTSIYGKLGVVSRSGAIRYAFDHQLG